MGDSTARFGLANFLAGPATPEEVGSNLRNRLGISHPTREPWAWTRDYPNLARFLAEGIPLALMAFGARAPARLPSLPRPTPAGEWPTTAAVRIGDRVFTGDSHFDAVTKAQAALGEDVTHRLLSGGGNTVALDGFITNTGRYVSREEAGRMLDGLNDTRHYKTWFGNDRKGEAGLSSEALELYDPKTGREKP